MPVGIEDYFPFCERNNRSPLVLGVINTDQIYLQDKNGIRVTSHKIAGEEMHNDIFSLAIELAGVRAYDISNLSDFLNKEEIARILKFKSTD